MLGDFACRVLLQVSAIPNEQFLRTCLVRARSKIYPWVGAADGGVCLPSLLLI
jgi:hypothetical protein